MRNITMNLTKVSVLAILISLVFAVGATANTTKSNVVSGTAMVQSKNVTAGTLGLRGKKFIVTHNTAIRNLQGQMITLEDIRSPNPDSGALFTSDDADSVYYEATADKGVLLKVEVVEAMPE